MFLFPLHCFAFCRQIRISLKSSLLDPLPHETTIPFPLLFSDFSMCVWNPCLIFVSFCLIVLLLQCSKEALPTERPPFLIIPPFSSTMASASTLLYRVFPSSLTTTFKTNHKDFSYFLSSLKYLALLILYFFFSFWYFLKTCLFFIL